MKFEIGGWVEVDGWMEQVVLDSVWDTRHHKFTHGLVAKFVKIYDRILLGTKKIHKICKLAYISLMGRKNRYKNFNFKVWWTHVWGGRLIKNIVKIRLNLC